MARKAKEGKDMSLSCGTKFGYRRKMKGEINATVKTQNNKQNVASAHCGACKDVDPRSSIRKLGCDYAFNRRYSNVHFDLI